MQTYREGVRLIQPSGRQALTKVVFSARNGVKNAVFDDLIADWWAAAPAAGAGRAGEDCRKLAAAIVADE
jgi:hypothetical protein